jgi:hypothetical protein
VRSHRLLAGLALLLTTVGAVLIVVASIERLPRGLATVAMLAVAAKIARDAILRRGAPRTVRLVLALVLLVAVVLLALTGQARWAGLVGVALIVLGLGAARRAFLVHARWPAAPRPHNPVVIWNAKSGGGKAVTHHLVEEATRRGIQPSTTCRSPASQQVPATTSPSISVSTATTSSVRSTRSWTAPSAGSTWPT